MSRTPQDSAPRRQPARQQSSAASRDDLLAGLEQCDADELCELAGLICAAPLAGTQLLAVDGTVCTTWHGDPPPARSFETTPCGQVLASGQALVIEDLLAASQPDGSPWELGELRAYAGVPIGLSDGTPLGTVCVFDVINRSFGDAQLRALELLAKQVARGIELARSTRATASAQHERATAVSELSRIEHRFHALVESSPLAIFAMDREAKPVFVSDGCAVLFGNSDRYDKTGWIPAVHEDDRARATAEWARAVNERSSIELQYRIYSQAGQIQSLIVSAAAVHTDEGEFDGWVGTINDISEQVEANRQLARARRASERVRADVEARNAELQAFARTKDSFLAAVSHEFRTPLTSITTFLQLLADEDDLSPTQRQAVTVIARNADRLEALVTDLLNVKESPGALELKCEAIDLREAAEDAVAAAALRAEEAGVGLTAQAGPSVWGWGDPKRMAQVIDGLIDNALKFTDAGGRIEVNVIETAAGPCVEIADNGVGIGVDELERVFDRFYQGPAGRSRGSGSGLGLAIARRLLDAQDASIEAHSAPGQGTTMRIGVRRAPSVRTPSPRKRSSGAAPLTPTAAP